jgi:hypothetical protein
MKRIVQYIQNLVVSPDDKGENDTSRLTWDSSGPCLRSVIRIKNPARRRHTIAGYAFADQSHLTIQSAIESGRTPLLD